MSVFFFIKEHVNTFLVIATFNFHAIEIYFTLSILVYLSIYNAIFQDLEDMTCIILKLGSKFDFTKLLLMVNILFPLT